MADKIIQLHDELGNNIYPITTIDALYGTGALANVFVDKKGDTMTGNLTAPKFIGALQGNADSSSKVNNSLSIQLNGGTATTFNGSTAKSINITPAAIGAAAASHGTHVTYSTTAPVMDGTASVGSAATVARSDHRHPTDTSRAAASDLTSHTGNTTVHITATERTNWNAAKTHADSAHAPSNAEKNQNAFSNIVVGSTTISADTVTDSLTLVGSNVTLTPDATNDKVTIGITKANVTTALGYTPPTQDTTYTAGTGISLSGTTINNSGVRSIATGGSNGTISVNTNGTVADVAVKGLGSAAYTASSDYAPASHSHSYLPLSGGTMTGDITMSGDGTQLLKAGSSTSWITGRDTALVRIPSYNAYNAITSMKTTNGSWEMGVYTNDYMYFTYCSDANYNAGTNSPTIQIKVTPTNGLYGAVWNDYAEFRNQVEEIKPGYCVASMDNGQVYKTTEKFQACDGIVSDTFGFSIGETDECKTPLAVAGRVLAYCEGNRYDYHSGDTVCAGPQGKVCKMTREEIREWPDRIIGIVSEIPEYERWGTCDVLVDGRIWIKIK